MYDYEYSVLHFVVFSHSTADLINAQNLQVPFSGGSLFESYIHVKLITFLSK